MAKGDFSVNKYIGKLHHHGCQTCHWRYTCSCVAPQFDRYCTDCKQGRPTSIMAGVQPAACCTEDEMRLATRHDRETYRLAGPGPWWLCHTCFRQFTTLSPRGARVSNGH